MRRRLGTILLLLGVLALLYPLFNHIQSRYYQAGLRWGQARLEKEGEPHNGHNGEEDPVLERPGRIPVPVADSDIETLFIEIPAIDVAAVVVRGTSLAQLKKAPGLYEESPLPGEEGANVAIAGHRTTYGAWFRHVDELVAGDEIRLTAGQYTYIYQVEEVFPVAKDDWSVIDPVEYEALTLTTCHPPGSARERLVVRSRYVKVLYPLRSR